MMKQVRMIQGTTYLIIDSVLKTAKIPLCIGSLSIFVFNCMVIFLLFKRFSCP